MTNEIIRMSPLIAQVSSKLYENNPKEKVWSRLASKKDIRPNPCAVCHPSATKVLVNVNHDQHKIIKSKSSLAVAT